MWYVYSYKDPKDGRIFYIGKGKGNRCKSHLYRAKTWVKRDKPRKCGSHNLHLLQLICKIWDVGNEPIIEIIKTFDNEQHSYDFEKQLIAKHHETLCNLTLGGEGFSGSTEVRLKMSIKRKEWHKTDAGKQWSDQMSKSRMGSGNPNFGKKEDEEHKIIRMKNFLAKERWNKGKSGDPRCKGNPKGNLPHNAKKCIAIHLQSCEIIEEESLGRLAKKLENHCFKISHSTICRIINKDKTFNGWRVEFVPKQ